MTGSLYTRTAISDFTRADAAGLNTEFAKIASAIDQLAALAVGGTGTPLYTWRAYADSADGTLNFTTGAPGSRAYRGEAINKATITPSAFPVDYTWVRIRGADGADAQTTEIRFMRSWAPPATPTDAVPAGWTTTQPDGDPTLWTISAIKDSAGALVSAWSPPAALSGPLPRGDYATGTTYYLSNLVAFSGGTYRAKTTTVGHPPSGTAQANAYWDVWSAPGAAGTPASPPSAPSSTITLTNSTTGVNLRTLADAAGYTGQSGATYTFSVPVGVTIQGAPGSFGIDTGSWPSGFTIALTLSIAGTVLGGGGQGGDGGTVGAGGVGGSAGDAIVCHAALSGGIAIAATGVVKGGGGGGQGGSGNRQYNAGEWAFYGGGGGGGGAPNGPGGDGGPDYGNGTSNPGVNGTTSGGGIGGTGASGNSGFAGGTFAAAGGGTGGLAGYAVRKNGFAATVTNSGTMVGTAA